MKIASRIIFCLLLPSLVTSVFTVSRVFASATVHNVSTGEDFATIKEAINDPETLNGHTILVDSGIYYESQIFVSKSVALIGENPFTTIIDGSGASTVVTISANDVTITGFTIRNSGYYGPQPEMFWAQPSLSSGIQVSSPARAAIVNNIITENGFGIIGSAPNATIEDNLITNNKARGIWLSSGAYRVIRNNTMNNNPVNFGIGSGMGYLEDFLNDVDSSNTVDGKPVYYWVNRHGVEVPADAGYVALVNSTDITVRNLILAHNVYGVNLVNTTDSIVENVAVSNSYSGIFTRLYSKNNTVVGSRFANNYYGVGIRENSTENSLYHCNIIDNFNQVFIADVGTLGNAWDNGAEGNFWSDYSGEDLNGDGLGDTPYGVDLNNQDNHPLMNPWPSHDVAVTSLSPSKTVVGKGYSLLINVTVANQGDFPENIDLAVRANDTTIANEVILSTSREFTDFTFTWDTSSFDAGNYTITAQVTPVPDESDTTDNTRIYSFILITIPGDGNGDGHVDSSDILALCKVYGYTSETPTWNANLDLNSDGLVDAKDLFDVGKNYGENL